MPTKILSLNITGLIPMCWQAEVENRIKGFWRCKDVCFTSNATTALQALVKGRGIKHVVLPVNICFSVPFAARRGGAKVEFVDVNPENGLLDFSYLQSVKSDGQTALVVPHLYGKTVNAFEKIITWADGNNVVVIEDIAQCFGGIFNQRYLGSFGDFAIASFGKGKNIDFGLGGALISNRCSLYKIRTILKYLPCTPDKSLKEKERLERMYTRGHYNNCSNDWFRQFYRQLRESEEVFINNLTGFSLIGNVDFNGIEEKNSDRNNQGAKIYKLLKRRFKNVFVEEAPDTGVWWRVRLSIPDSIQHDRVLSILIQKGIKVSKLYGNVARLFNHCKRYIEHEKFYRQSLFVDITKNNLDRLTHWE